MNSAKSSRPGLVNLVLIARLFAIGECVVGDVALGLVSIIWVRNAAFGLEAGKLGRRKLKGRPVDQRKKWPSRAVGFSAYRSSVRNWQMYLIDIGLEACAGEDRLGTACKAGNWAGSLSPEAGIGDEACRNLG